MTSRYPYEKRRRHLKHIGQPLRVPAHGFTRRAKALMALGWPQVHIATELGIDRRNLSTMIGNNRNVSRAHHDRMATIYDRLCMTIPEPTLASRRVKAMAKRRGWAPPLAYDDIDDATEEPKLGRRPDPRGYAASEHAFLTRFGESDDAIAEALGIDPGSLEMALFRANRKAA